jgi:hypothetical protein
MLKTILKQNYFQVNQEYYKQTDGLAMGAPTSSMLAETYIEHMEHTHINIPHPHNTIKVAYFTYADDILIIYDQNNNQT